MIMTKIMARILSKHAASSRQARLQIIHSASARGFDEGQVGFSVFPATDGAEALRWSEQYEGAIEIVVSDIVMPELNGLELSKRIRVARPETKFLFITGFGDQFPELREYGENVLEKPFLPSELVRKVDDILNQGHVVTGTG